MECNEHITTTIYMKSSNGETRACRSSIGGGGQVGCFGSRRPTRGADGGGGQLGCFGSRRSTRGADGGGTTRGAEGGVVEELAAEGGGTTTGGADGGVVEELAAEGGGTTTGALWCSTLGLADLCIRMNTQIMHATKQRMLDTCTGCTKIHTP